MSREETTSSKFATTEEKNLCLDIVAEEFGPIVTTVVQAFLLRQSLTFSQLSSIVQPKIEIKVLQQALVVLLEHNILEFRKNDSVILYNISIDSILLRLRFPKFIHQSHEKFGLSGEVIMEYLLTSGRLRLDECLLDLAQGLYEKQREEDTDDDADDTPLFISEKAEIKSTFSKMIQSRFIVRVNPLVQDPKPPSAKKRKVESSTSTSTIDPSIPVELQLLEQSSKVSSSKVSSSPIRKKQKTKELFDATNVIWKAGVEQMLIASRHNAVSRFATENTNAIAGSIVSSILSQSILKESLQMPVSFPASVSSLVASTSTFNILKFLPEGCKKNSTTASKMISNYITLLCKDRVQVLEKAPTNGTSSNYSVNTQRVISELRLKTLHHLVAEKFGVESSRILKVLMLHSQLEQKTIGELVMLPSADVRRRLYELYKEQWVILQEVPKRSDYNPLQTFYTWSVNIDRVFEVVIPRRVLHILLNLRKRRDFEMKSGSELIQRSDSLVDKGDIENFDSLSKTLDRLDQSIIRTEGMLTLFKRY